MRYDLKAPCKNCPWNRNATGIRFACRERAEEIEEQAYRDGFPCHLTAEHVEEDDYGQGGFMATEDSQMCGGFMLTYIRDGGDEPPPSFAYHREEFEPYDDKCYEHWDQLRERVHYGERAPVFETMQEWFDQHGEETS